jgi:hypothetical protein
MDQDTASIAELEAWQPPSQPVREQEITAAFAELLQVIERI